MRCPSRRSPPRAEQAIPYCATHPEVETELRCGRCEKYICPRCMVHTPGGVRCRECAQLRRPVMYELAARDYVFAALAAAATALPLGVVGGLLLAPAASANFFAIVLALLAGSGAGSAVAAVIAWATNRKRGLALQLIAAGSLVIAALIRLVVAGGIDQLTRDVVGIFALVVAIVVAWGRLR